MTTKIKQITHTHTHTHTYTNTHTHICADSERHGQ